MKEAREAASAAFKAEVESEVLFQKSIPLMDDSGRKKAEALRKNLRSIERAQERFYHGPPLDTTEASEAEDDRLEKLRLKHNQISARWSKIKKQAKTIYLKWANEELKKQLTYMDFDLVQQELIRNKKIESINEVMAKRQELYENNTGNGSKGSGSGKTTTTLGTRLFQ